MVFDQLLTEEESDKYNTHLDIFKDKDQARKWLEGYSLNHWAYEYEGFFTNTLEYPFKWWTSSPSGSLSTPLNGQRRINVWRFLLSFGYLYEIAIFPKFEQQHEVYFILKLECSQYIDFVDIYYIIDDEINYGVETTIIDRDYDQCKFYFPQA